MVSTNFVLEFMHFGRIVENGERSLLSLLQFIVLLFDCNYHFKQLIIICPDEVRVSSEVLILLLLNEIFSIDPIVSTAKLVSKSST